MNITRTTHIPREATDRLCLLIGALVGAAPLAAVGRGMIAAWADDAPHWDPGALESERNRTTDRRKFRVHLVQYPDLAKWGD